MPTIPRYDDQQVSSNALPGQRQQVAAPIEAFGGQFAEDLGKVAKVVGGVTDKAMDMHIRAVEAADKSAVLDALGEADREAQFEGDRLTGEIGKYTGPNAEIKQPFSSTYEQSLSAIYDKPRNRLSPRQQRMYDERAAEIRQRHASKGVDLEIKANNNFMVATATNDIRNSDNDVANYGADDFFKPVVGSADGKNDKTAFDLAVDRLRDSVSVMAGVNGWTKPEEDKRVDEAIGVWVAKSAERFIEKGDTISAGGLLHGKYGDKVDGDTKKKILDSGNEKSVEIAAIKDAKTFIADKLSLGDALAAVDKKHKNPLDAEKAKKTVREQYGIAKQVQAFDWDRARTELLTYQKNHPGAMPSSITSRMDPDVVRALEAAQSKAAEGVAVETDPKVFAALLNMTVARDPNLTDDVFWKHADKLKHEDVIFLVKKRAEMLKPGEEGADAVTSAQQLTAQIKLLGLQGKAEGEFMQAYYRDLDSATASGGKRVGIKERQEILTRLALKTRGGERAFKFDPSEYDTVDWAIPEEDLAKMKARAPNLDWDDKNVRNRQYVQYKLTGKPQ